MDRENVFSNVLSNDISDKNAAWVLLGPEI